MSILEAISPTSRALLNHPISGGGIVNAITKNTKTGKHRVHIPASGGTPLCGGGNSARSAQWQEVIIAADCRRCLSIQKRKNNLNDYEI